MQAADDAKNTIAAHDDGLDKWNATVKSLNGDYSRLPEVRQAFMDTYGQGILDNLPGKAGWTQGSQQRMQQGARSVYDSLDTATRADMVHLSGIKAQNDVEELGNVASTATAKNPFTYKMNMDTMHSAIDKMVEGLPGLDAAQAESLKTELRSKGDAKIANAWALGLTNQNPDAALKAFQNIPGDLAGHLDGARIVADARQASNNKKALAGLALAQQERNDRISFNHAAADLSGKMDAATQAGDLAAIDTLRKQIDIVGRMNGAPAGFAGEMYDRINRAKDELVAGGGIQDNQIGIEAVNRARDSGGDTVAVAEEQVRLHNLSPRSLDKIRQRDGMMDQQQQMEAAQVRRGAADGYHQILQAYSVFGHPEMGQSEGIRYENAVEDAIHAGLSSGSTIQKMLTDPKDPHYIPDITKQFVPSMTDPAWLNRLKQGAAVGGQVQVPAGAKTITIEPQRPGRSLR